MADKLPPKVIASLSVLVTEPAMGGPPNQRVEGPFNDPVVFVQLLQAACTGFLNHHLQLRQQQAARDGAVELPGSPAEINDLLGNRRITGGG